MKMNFFEKLEQILMPIAEFFSTQKHLLAMRDGMVSTLPFTIIGSIFLIIGCPPVDPSTISGTGIISKFLIAWYNFANQYAGRIFPGFNATMGIMSLFVVGSIAYHLAKRYGLKAHQISISVTSIFILAITPIKDGGIPVNYLDAKGIFLGIIIAIASVELMRFFINKGFTIKLPKGVPESVADSFSSLIPFTFTLVIVYGVTIIIESVSGKMIADLWYSILSPAIKGADSILFIGPLMLIENILWAFGVHNNTITGPIITTFGTMTFTANASAHMAGQALPYIFTKPFWSFYLAVGGGGATMGAVLLALKSKSKHIRAIGKVSILPALFNINEPLIFGLPIFLNPMMFIPFVITPVVNACLGFFVTKIGLVKAAVANAPWTSPAPIGALLSTLDWRAAVFVIVLIIIDAIIFFPFLKMFERKLLQDEESCDNELKEEKISNARA